MFLPQVEKCTVATPNEYSKNTKMIEVLLNQTVEYLWMRNPEYTSQLYEEIRKLKPTMNIIIGIYFDKEGREHVQVYGNVDCVEKIEDEINFSEYTFTMAGLFVAEYQRLRMVKDVWQLKLQERMSQMEM